MSKWAEAVHALEHEVVRLGELVEAQLDGAVAALLRRDAVLAEEVLRGDDEVDARDARIEQAGLSVLADRSLPAAESRTVTVLIRVVTQLERLGDLAVGLAERASTLAARPQLVGTADDLARMAARVQTMVKLALAALATRECALARKVLAMDEAVDEIHRATVQASEKLMREDPDTIERALTALAAARAMARIGDHARSVAADAIYLVEGRVVAQAPAPRDPIEKILLTA
ncbi:MAG TPA: phosphate signaling complex protein PhoU [Planctomycetota bacterium]|nr:phosphate signaling complex protein PhoU [Planctomycetota bacterium]